MKAYIQTETQQGQVADPRPKVLLLETAGDAAAALGAIAPRLGLIIAIPAAAHESNLRALLVRDLAEHGVLPGASEDGREVVLKVIRTPKGDAPPGQAEVWNLSYQLQA